MKAKMPDSAELRRIAMANPSAFLAFGLGSGLSPKAPGTVGTVAALLPAIALVQLPMVWALAVVVLAFVIGVVICEWTGRELGVHDHGGLVWDEFVGMWLVLLFVPIHWAWWLAAFVAFRVFDVIKPWPIRWVDSRVKGGFGVMIDDVIAAIFALAVLLPVLWWGPW